MKLRHAPSGEPRVDRFDEDLVDEPDELEIKSSEPTQPSSGAGSLGGGPGHHIVEPAGALSAAAQ